MLGRSGNQNASAKFTGLERQNRIPTGRVQKRDQQQEIELTGIAVIIHPSNPISELTLEQIRKIYTGEYDNWAQVGGPDRQVKVFAGDGMFEDQPALASKASVSAFASDVFVGVADTREAIGFVPHTQHRQLRFLGGHDAVRILAIRDAG